MSKGPSRKGGIGVSIGAGRKRRIGVSIWPLGKRQEGSNVRAVLGQDDRSASIDAVPKVDVAVSVVGKSGRLCVGGGQILRGTGPAMAADDASKMEKGVKYFHMLFIRASSFRSEA